MKRTFSRLMLTALCLLTLAVGALGESVPEMVGNAPEDEFIFRYVAPNGQEIYFVARENPPYVKMEDVNFDGVDDLVITTIIGATNFYTEFFVWDGDKYVMASHTGAQYGLCNYTLYKESGLVLSSQNNGMAGALFERHLFRWEGTNLTLVRSAVSEEYSTVTFDADRFTTVTDQSRVRIVLRDFTQNIYEGDVLSDQTITLYEFTSERFAAEEAALFEGLK